MPASRCAKRVARPGHPTWAGSEGGSWRNAGSDRAPQQTRGPRQQRTGDVKIAGQQWPMWALSTGVREYWTASSRCAPSHLSGCAFRDFDCLGLTG
eukprot:231661-Rhodomonas_salina.2